MQTSDTPTYRLWDGKRTVEEPVELPALVNLVRSGRATAESWIFLNHTRAWSKAGQLPELGIIFKKTADRGAGASGASGSRTAGVTPEALRRVKILSQMSDRHLELLLTFLDILPIDQFAKVVSQGEHGDAMYFVLEGELRARVVVAGKETILATLQPGDFFGEISILDHGPRSADVVANQDSLVLRLSADGFEKLVGEAPDLASPLLFALSKSIVGRVRGLTKRYEDSIHLARVAGTR